MRYAPEAMFTVLPNEDFTCFVNAERIEYRLSGGMKLYNLFLFGHDAADICFCFRHQFFVIDDDALERIGKQVAEDGRGFVLLAQYFTGCFGAFEVLLNGGPTLGEV